MSATPIEPRFWRKVKKEPGGCWPWVGFRERDGYGLIHASARLVLRAHRFSYSLHFGPIPDGLCVLHRCDNPPCVNPEHLFLGTRKENNEDKCRKGRNCPRKTSQRGELNQNAKLTRADIVEIKRLRVEEKLTQQVIADRFGVAQVHVSRVLRGRVWTEV